MLCPSCRTELKMAERQHIEIDYCPQCRGVWLERGELDKIVERSQQPHTAPRRDGRENRDGYRDEGHDVRHRRKKSFLSELLDF